jgi:hypothetical protein
LPSRASHPTAIDTVDLGALTPFSNALRLDAPLDCKKFHTKPAVSPIVLVSNTVKTSWWLVCHLHDGFQISAGKIFSGNPYASLKRQATCTTKGTKSTKFGNYSYSETFVCSLENTGRRGLGHFKQTPSIMSFQHGLLESRLTWTFPDASSRIWIPAIHAGMTKICIFMFCGRA